MKKFCIRFSVFGLLVAVLQLLPNIIWALKPPVMNVLAGNASSIPFVEYGEHILGVLIVVLLVLLVNRKQQSGIPRTHWTVIGFAAIVLYWLCWMLYFDGVQVYAVIYAMVILPPVAFFCVGLAKSVWPIPVASVFFLVFHLLTVLENFPVSMWK